MSLLGWHKDPIPANSHPCEFPFPRSPCPQGLPVPKPCSRCPIPCPAEGISATLACHHPHLCHCSAGDAGHSRALPTRVQGGPGGTAGPAVHGVPAHLSGPVPALHICPAPSRPCTAAQLHLLSSRRRAGHGALQSREVPREWGMSALGTRQGHAGHGTRPARLTQLDPRTSGSLLDPRTAGSPHSWRQRLQGCTGIPLPLLPQMFSCTAPHLCPLPTPFLFYE